MVATGRDVASSYRSPYGSSYRRTDRGSRHACHEDVTAGGTVRHLMHRHLGKAVAGAAVALTGTAAMVAITLPSDAGATGGRDPRSRPAAAAPGRDQGPPPPGVVEKAPTEGNAAGDGTRSPTTNSGAPRIWRCRPPGAAPPPTSPDGPGPNASPPTWPNSPPRRPGSPTRRAGRWSPSTTTRATATSPRPSTSRPRRSSRRTPSTASSRRPATPRPSRRPGC